MDFKKMLKQLMAMACNHDFFNQHNLTFTKENQCLNFQQKLFPNNFHFNAQVKYINNFIYVNQHRDMGKNNFLKPLKTL